MSMHQTILLWLFWLLRMLGRADCTIVVGIRTTLKIPRRNGRQYCCTQELPQRISHPMRQPGAKYLFVNPEHLKIVTLSISDGSTRSAKVGEGSSQLISSYIQSAKIGIFLLIHNFIISRLCSIDQTEPRGFEGSFTRMNFVRSSIRFYISSRLACQLFPACKWQKRGSISILLAIVSVRGNPGDGNKKLSPGPASRLITAHRAMLPPAVRQTSSLLSGWFLLLKVSTTACLADYRP